MSENAKSFAKPKDLKHWAYETTKRIILDGQLAPGDQLRIDELAEKMSISRTPIREALLRLESEGLVRANSRVGFFVAEIKSEDCQELFELRELTEGLAAEKAAAFLTERDLAKIDDEQEKAIAAFARNDLMKFNEHEIALHDSIIEHSHNRWLLRMIEGLKDLTYREWLYALRSRENVELSISEHEKLIAALHNRDVAAAGNLMRQHLRNVNRRLQQILSQPAQEGKEPES